MEKGDIITLESAAINTKGTVDNSIEFSGKNNADENKLIDNKATLELSYYINDVGQYTLRLPTIGMSTYTNYGTVNDASNQSGTKFSVIEYLKNRCLGEVDLSIYDKTGATAFSNQRQMPTEGYVANLEISSTGSLFQIGNTYETVLIQPNPPPAGQLPGSGLKIMCTDTISEGSIVGALSEFKIVWGTFDYTLALTMTVTNPASGSNDATISMVLVIDKIFVNF